MGVFPKGLVHGFRLKVSIFPFFCFRQKRPGKYVSRYSRKKKHLSTFKKQEVQEVENFQFFKRGQSMVLVKGKRAEKCVLRYSRKKKRFSKTIETRSLKGQKFVFFPKGLAHDFGQKLAIFPFFLFQATLARKMCFTIFQNEKTFFQTIKTTT